MLLSLFQTKIHTLKSTTKLYQSPKPLGLLIQQSKTTPKQQQNQSSHHSTKKFKKQNEKNNNMNQQIISQFKTKQTDYDTIIAIQKRTQLRILRAPSERFRAFLNSNGRKKTCWVSLFFVEFLVSRFASLSLSRGSRKEKRSLVWSGTLERMRGSRAL